LQNETAKNNLILVLITDLINFIIWLLGLFGNEVKWKGQTFIVNQDNQLQLKNDIKKAN
jgi:hypothetical protein